MKNKGIVTSILVLIILTGLSLMLYPMVADYVNSKNQSRAISSYVQTLGELDSSEFDSILSEAMEYNRSLAEGTRRFHLTEEQSAKYPTLLRTPGTDVMGYIEISKIKCNLPLYHGTDEAVLSVAAGHIEWSSLPVGGSSSHCVISGHTGLPSSKLFTDLDQLEIGDTFVLRVLNLILTYEVDQILIVEPDDLNALAIVPGEDYCTLVTCTPYGVNSHRILVRGHRIENLKESESIRVTSDAIPIDSMLIALFLALPILFLLVLAALLKGNKAGARKPEKNGGFTYE